MAPANPTYHQCAVHRDADAADAMPHYLAPPQGQGGPQRLFSEGAPAGIEKPNVALRVLHDPVARNTFSRVYSGQRRGWNR